METIVEQSGIPHTHHQSSRVRLLSEEHFSVDGTLLEALASVNSFRRIASTKTLPKCRPWNQPRAGGISNCRRSGES